MKRPQDIPVESTGSPEPADHKVSTPPVGSPKPADSKGSITPIGSSESATPKFSPPSLGGSGVASSEGPKVPEPEPNMAEGTEALVRVSEVVSVPVVQEDSRCLGASTEITAPEESRDIGASSKPAVPKGPQPLSLRPDPVPGLQRLDTPTLRGESRSEYAIAEIPQQRVTTSGVQEEESVPEVDERKSGNVKQEDRISYEVTIQVLANPDDRRARILILSSTHAELYCDRLVVHGTRRVLEVLLMAWRSGYRLGEMTRYVRLGEENELRMPICVRDLLDRVVIGSTIIALFETDDQGASVQIRYALLKSLLEHPQTLEAECRRCDPLRPAHIIVDQEDDSTGCIFSLRLEARQYPAKTFVHDLLRESSGQEHLAVSLCQTLTHWMRVPGVHRVRPGWGLLTWPVPLRELQQREGP